MKVLALISFPPRSITKLFTNSNQTALSKDVKETITDFIALQIKKTPALPALVSRHEVITYAEMDHRTAIITANLRLRGVHKGIPVGIHLEISPEMVMCIIAVSGTGGIYIPLDPYYPEEGFAMS